MANYEACVRTNYFRVTDERTYQELFKRLSAESHIYDFTKKDPDTGDVYHGFGTYSSIDYYPPSEKTEDEIDEDEYCDDPEPNIDAFFEGVQKVIHPDDALIFIEIGNEKLRYFNAYAVVVTKDKINATNLEQDAMALARKMLKNPDYTTSCEY